jgi:hypothetical protein
MKDWIKVATILFGIIGGFACAAGFSIYQPIAAVIGTISIFIVGCLLMYNDKGINK